MRYHILATDYDGTLADQGRVLPATLDKLKALKATGRLLVLVTGREMRDLVVAFPDYRIFDHIVAENGALIHTPATGAELLLGPPPDAAFVKALEDSGVTPISVGQVIVATWEPHEQTVLEVIKAAGIERQVIFNKGAVMILPSGVNKATGLQALLKTLHHSLHGVAAVGDAENDGAMLRAAECAVAVNNALPALKTVADWVTDSTHGSGVIELMDRMMTRDLADLDGRLGRHFLELGTHTHGAEGSFADPGAAGGSGGPFAISPYRSGILLSGVSGGGKTTFTILLAETLIKQEYQFCLIDPEGDYLQLPGAVVIGNETTLPPLEEIHRLLQEPGQSLVICTLSVPVADRPAFFARLLPVIVDLRREYGRPHWLLLDEAHHLVPAASERPEDRFPDGFNNFVLISTSPDTLSPATLGKVGMVITIGSNAAYPIEQFCQALELPVPSGIPTLKEDEICVWDREVVVQGGQGEPYSVKFHLPSQLLQRHKKKYAQGDMSYNSFVFTGAEHKLNLVANNLMLFIHLAEGIDADTWNYHLQRKDYSNWFRCTVHDDELAANAEEAEKMDDPAASKQKIIESINAKYTA